METPLNEKVGFKMGVCIHWTGLDYWTDLRTDL